MCGILGSLPNTDKDFFSKNLNLLSHRGPDAEGIIHIRDEISFGHKRLSIIDLSENASQPMTKFSRFHLIFNGEIYNFIEIKENLLKKGYKFVSNSDSEVLIYSYIEWGENCVNFFNGMWAFAIWDSLQKKLFLSRDRLGEKPLYYSLINNGIVFASEQKAILPFLDEISASKQFKELVKDPYSYSKSNKTLFSKILKFPPGHNGTFYNQKLKIERFWIPNFSKANYNLSYSEQVEYLNYLIEDSCKLRLRSDVPIATALSGGIDSSTIASFVKNIYQKNQNNYQFNRHQTGFNMSFPGSVMDENHYSKKISESLGIRLKTVTSEKSKMALELEKVCYLFEDIQEVNPLPHYFLYQNIKSNGFSVSLDGHGGDELFCGYESSILNAIPENIFDLNKINYIYKIYCDIHPKNKYFKKMNLIQICNYLLKNNIKLNLKNNLDKDMQGFFSNLNSLSKHLFVLTFETVLPTLLRNYDRYSMMSGVEIRMPLLDYRIVEFAFSLPWQSKLKDGYSKSILREQIKDSIPRNIVYKKSKIGFSPPIQEWFKGPLKEYFLDEINSNKFKNSNLINSKVLKRKINKVIFSDINYMHYGVESIWKEFSIYLWEKIFL